MISNDFSKIGQGDFCDKRDLALYSHADPSQDVL